MEDVYKLYGVKNYPYFAMWNIDKYYIFTRLDANQYCSDGIVIYISLLRENSRKRWVGDWRKNNINWSERRTGRCSRCMNACYVQELFGYTGSAHHYQGGYYYDFDDNYNISLCTPCKKKTFMKVE